MPHITCPYNLQLHPDTNHIETNTNTWATTIGLPTPTSTRVGWLGAACHPNGNQDRVLLASKFLHIIFAFDDHIDQPHTTPWTPARTALQITHIAEDPHHQINTNHNPLLAALNDITHHLRNTATPSQYQRFTTGLTEWMLGQLGGGFAPTTITPADYNTIRRYNTNGMVCYGLIDYTLDIELPHNEWTHPNIARLTRIASDIMGYTNDVLSWPKEHTHNPNAVNLITITAREHHISLHEAAKHTSDHINTLYQQFHHLSEHTKHTATPTTNAYIHGLQAWLAGQHHWSLHTPRYTERNTP